MSYDQWKTASPYDDEPDVIEECYKMAKRLENWIETHKELSDLTRAEEFLLRQAADTLTAAAEFIEAEI